MSSGTGSTGSAVNFNNGFNFSFVQCKVGSANSHVFTYSNQPANISFIRNIYSGVGSGSYVHNIPATGYPLALQFDLEAGLASSELPIFTNNWGLFQFTIGGSAYRLMSQPTMIAGGNSNFMQLYDGTTANQWSFLTFQNGIIGVRDANQNLVLDIDTVGKVLRVYGTAILTLPTSNPGPGGGLYQDPATFAVYQGH
jgi:hypothetical protein